jgi:uncharacterized protein with GYD domain
VSRRLHAHLRRASSTGPTTESLAAALLAVAGQGNIRTTTLRAFSGEEMRTIIGKVG